jgi:hypothetical protein
MEKSAGNGLFLAFVVVAILMALSMFISASGKLTLNPGAVTTIHQIVGVPMSWLTALAVCEIAG